MRPRYPDYIQHRFDRDVTEHQLTVLHENGLYRHLRFKRPDTGLEYFDIVTWPYHLHIGGDRDGYTFSRVEDMFGFFRRVGREPINPDYWAEKVTDGRERTKKYSRERTEEKIWRAVRDEYEAHGRDAKGLAKAVHEELFDDWDNRLDFEDAARRVIDDFTFTFAESDVKVRFDDNWEWDLRDWDYHYLWSCHAIAWGIGQYDAAKATRDNEPVAAGAS